MSLPTYETVVHGTSLSEDRASNDPASFTNVIKISEAQANADFVELLQRVPGLRMRGDSLSGSQTISLRASDGQQVAVFLDGVRLDSPVGQPIDLALFDPAHLQEIEVRRGGNSARLGGEAIGGAVLLKTAALRQRPQFKGAVEYGSFNSLGARLMNGGKIASGSYLLSAAYHQTDGDFLYLDDNGVAQRRFNNDGRGGQAIIKGGLPIAHRWRWEFLDDFGAQFRGAPGMSQRPSLTARQSDLRNLTALRLIGHDLWLPQGQAEFIVHHHYQRFSFSEPSPPQVDSQNQCFTSGGQMRTLLPLGQRLTIESGLEGRGVAFLDPATDNPTRAEADANLAAQIFVWSRRITFIPALRASVAGGFSPVLVPKSGIMVSPLASSKSPWLSGWELAANFGRSFRYPSFQEMYIRLDGFGGNPTLQPEDSWEGDAGIRFRHPRFFIESVYFRRYMDNVILFAPVSSFLVRPDNYPTARVFGAESSFRLSPGAGFLCHAAYTFTRTAFGEPAMQLPGHPRHRLATRLQWNSSEAFTRFRRINVQTHIGATFQNEMVLSRFDSTVEEGRVLLSAGAAITYRMLTLSADGDNLLNKRDAVDTVGFPLAPARFFVSLSASM